jgi:hypothetical protein
MIQATSSPDGVHFRVSINGVRIYLDNWAVIDLAERDASRRKRFIAALCSGKADLLFSATNAAQLTQQRGASFEAVKSFLDEIGPYWVPVELNPLNVVERERQGADPATSYVSPRLFEAFVENGAASRSPDSVKTEVLSPDFLRLGALLNWVAGNQSLPELSKQFDEIVKTRTRSLPTNTKPRLWLDRHYPAQKFNRLTPATFVFTNLLRTMVIESGQLKEGDAMDLCHASIGSAFATVAALDKNWKRRVEGLPQPNRLACIYGPAELNQMVTDIELLVA